MESNTGSNHKEGKQVPASSLFNLNISPFDEQSKYLDTISKETLEKLVYLFDESRNYRDPGEFMSRRNFNELHQMLYETKFIFNFDWMNWPEGLKNINNPNFNYSNCSLLEISMYLTTIFRSDRFIEGTIECSLNDGTLDKIFNQLKNKIPNIN